MGYYFISYRYSRGDCYGSGSCIKKGKRLTATNKDTVGEYMSVTTLDEAIDHCFSIVNSTDENICAECKAEHLKLCGWLGELKRRKDAEQALKENEANVNL